MRKDPLQRFLAVIFTVALMLSLSFPGAAQQQTGDLFGRVVNAEGQSLPRATVTLSGPGAPQTRTTDDDGRFRFVGLAPGSYRLEATLPDFTTATVEALPIQLGTNTEQVLQLVPVVAGVIVVNDVAPALDTREVARGAVVTKGELEKLPTGRDPWALLPLAPGVTTDRVNVAGSESGQQSVFLGTGAASSENTYALDGVVITDMSATGASPMYYDFGSFEEVQLSTGGTDIATSSAGVTLNIVTARGGNEWRGSGRVFRTDEDLVADPAPNAGDFPAGQDPQAFRPNRLEAYQDVGLELGGPVIKDHLWLWGAASKTEIDTLAGGGVPNAAELENATLKLNAQLTPSTALQAQWSDGNKIVAGRDAGPTRPPETTWNQDGPTTIWKAEGSQVLGSNAYVEGLVARVDSLFALAPRGGLATPARLDADGVFRDSFVDVATDRPSDQARLNAAYFAGAGEVQHELRFGVGYRDFSVHSRTVWPGDGVVHLQGENFGIGGTTEVALVTRPGNAKFKAEYGSLWLQDTFTRDRWTFNLGARYDEQRGENLASTAAASERLPGVLPAVTFAGNDPGFTWKTVSPRLHVTYALGQNRETLLRASYSRFAQQLATGFVSALNPTALASVYAIWEDHNSNGLFDDGEPFELASVASPNLNQVDPELDPSVTEEAVVGLEHAFGPHWVVRWNGTFREISNIQDARPLVRERATGVIRTAQREDYSIPVVVTHDGREITYFELDPRLENTGATRLTNGARGQRYVGTSLAFERRLANGWSSRGSVAWNDWTWDVPAAFAAIDDPTDNVDDFDNDGGTVAEQSAGSGNRGDVWIGARWTAQLSGVYQVAAARPWGFNVAANVTARDGFPSPEFLPVVGNDGRSLNVAVGDFNDHRNDALVTTDLRLEKDLNLGPVTLNVGLDAFNVFNEATVLQRERNLSLSSARFVRETLAPRAFRLGLTLSYR